MHRSVTFSEIFSSTFSDDLNKYGESYDKNVKAKFIAKIGIGLVEFLLSSIFLCYGIIFSNCVSHQYYTIQDGLWITILYTSSWSITSPWSRHIYEYFEINKYSVFRYIIFAATILLFIGFIIPGQILSYGVFGGIFSNLITTQLRFIATEKFDMDLKVFDGNVQVARALTLLIMPHFVLLLVSYYTTYQMKYIFGAFLLNIFPAALIIKPLNIQKEYSEISRYQTLPAFSNQMREMMEFSNSVNLSDHNKSDSSSPADEEDEKEVNSESENYFPGDINSVNEQLLQPVYLTPLTVQTYYEKAGVSILPEIPEELENEADDNIRDMISARRLSKISTKLEELNQLSKRKIETLEETEHFEPIPCTDNNSQESNGKEDNKKDTITEILNINDLISTRLSENQEKIENIEYIPNYKENNFQFLKDLRTINQSFCCGCSPYRKFIWKRRFRSKTDFLMDNIFKPLLISVKDVHFYPIVISKTATNVISTLYITLAPYLASVKEGEYQLEDAAFLLSYIAFSWCLFLVLLPLVINFSNGKCRVTFICGLLLAGTSMTLISRRMTNDVVTISCLLFGFGYGVINYTENTVYRSFIGARKWNLIEGTLETTSALFVILSYFIIYNFNLGISVLLFIAFATYYVNAILWISAPIFKNVLIYISKFYCRRRQNSIL